MITILVIENELHQRVLYKMVLEDEGYRVVLAATGEEGVRYVKDGSPDLVVLDLGLPDMNGLKALEQILAIVPGLPIVIYSAYEHFKDNPMTSAANAYVVKSSNLNVLQTEIRRVLKKHAGMRPGSIRLPERASDKLAEPKAEASGREEFRSKHA